MENARITLAMLHSRAMFEGACQLNDSLTKERLGLPNGSPSRLMGYLYGSIILSCVAIELGLKAWLMSEGKKYARNHDLPELFSQLSNPLQETINSVYQQIRMSRVAPESRDSRHISEVLCDLRDVFIKIRYMWHEPPRTPNSRPFPAINGEQPLHAAEAVLKAYDKWPPDSWEHPSS